jgi:hypothetical protein
VLLDARLTLLGAAGAGAPTNSRPEVLIALEGPVDAPKRRSMLLRSRAGLRCARSSSSRKSWTPKAAIRPRRPRNRKQCRHADRTRRRAWRAPAQRPRVRNRRAQSPSRRRLRPNGARRPAADRYPPGAGAARAGARRAQGAPQPQPQSRQPRPCRRARAPVGNIVRELTAWCPDPEVLAAPSDAPWRAGRQHIA